MEMCKVLGQMQSLGPFPSAPAAGSPRFRHFIRPLTPRCCCSATASSSRSRWSSSPGRDGEKRMFVLGMGFVGRYVSQRLISEGGWEVSGTCTRETTKNELEKMGFNTFVFEATENRLENLNSLQYATHLLVSIPPIAEIGDPLLSMHEELQDTLSYGNLRWLGYLSSTSVYGDCRSSLVDEHYPANLVSNSAKSRLTAEEGWINLGRHIGVSTYIFRLGGIYGPGRSALDTILKGKPLSKSQRTREIRRFTARVHVADIYQAIKASFDVSSSGRTYNVVDDDPAPRSEVFAFALNLIKEKCPDWVQKYPSLDAVDLVIQEESMKGEKRVSNTRLKEELGVNLLYPSYRLGLQSILNSL